jgi:7-cyano-7-deazaguanine synthase
MRSEQRSRSRALVLLSGGVDSAVAALIAAEHHAHLHFLSFDYRQANRKELACARRIAKVLDEKAPHDVVALDLTPVARSNRSSLLSGRSRGDRPHRAEDRPYLSYVPGRNMIFLSYAAAVAEVNDVEAIYVGSNLQDSMGPGGRGYPDSSAAFVRAAETALNEGLKYADPIRVVAPLLGMNRFDVIRYGHARGLDFRLTWSCYGNGARACGTCGACRARILNFHWAGLVDPIAYRVPFARALSLALS